MAKEENKVKRDENVVKPVRIRGSLTWKGRAGRGGGRDRLERRGKREKRNTRRISSTTLLDSERRHGNSSEARRAADGQIRSLLLISASLYVSRPEISGQLISVPGCVCRLLLPPPLPLDQKG